MEFTNPRFGVARYPVMILIKIAITEKWEKALFSSFLFMNQVLSPNRYFGNNH